MFLNFGGPGGSGTETLPGLFVGASSVNVEALLGGYDLISWDPRGVGSTLPALTCYASEALRAANEPGVAPSAISQTNDSIALLDARQRLRAAGCTTYGSKVAPYVGTMYVAQDLRRFVERCGYSDKLSYL